MILDGVAIGSSAGSSRATFNEPTEERSVRGGGREEDIPLDESRDHGRNNSTVKEVELNEKTTQFCTVIANSTSNLTKI